MERDRLRRACLSARLQPLREPPPAGRRARGLGGPGGLRRGSRPPRARGPTVVTPLGSLVKGATRMPRENDSPWLLHPHRRGLQNLERMRRYSQREEVDLLIVGAGAGGITLAQRLARAGWRIVIVEKGPFWDPDRDWVSDEAGSHSIYWTDKRIIGGSDPIEMGKNNSGVGVGGPMTHFAGYTPRLHPSDFEVHTRD